MTQDDLSARQARDLRFGLEEALDGELPGEMVERMAQHTLDCPECADEWERLSRIKELVRRSCVEPAPSSLRERITVEYRAVAVTREEDGQTSTTSVRVTRPRTQPPRH